MHCSYGQQLLQPFLCLRKFLPTKTRALLFGVDFYVVALVLIQSAFELDGLGCAWKLNGNRFVTGSCDGETERVFHEHHQFSSVFDSA